MRVTASANEYLSDLRKTPIRLAALFLDETSEMPRYDRKRLSGAISVASEALAVADRSSVLSAFRWLHEMSGFDAGKATLEDSTESEDFA